MKNFMKFIPLALGLLTLASCSNDDFFGESQKQDFRATLGEGDLVVTMPSLNFDGNALTRGLRDFKPGADEITYYFTEKDEIRVYDDALTKYNIYEYRTKDATGDDGEPLYAFRMKNTYSNIKGDPVYALYPREDIIRGHWDYVNDTDDLHHGDDNHTQGWIDVNIDPYMTYWADYSRDYDPTNEEPLYQDRLPMWGKIIADGGYVESKMEYLTGILCYQLYDADKRFTCLKVQMLDAKTKEPLNIAGTFKAVIEDNNIVKIAYESDGKTVIEDKTARISYLDLVDEEDASDEIVVDLRGKVGLNSEDAKHLKVFVPLVCTDYDNDGVKLNKKVDIVVYASEDDNCKNYKKVWEAKNKTIERGMYYFNGQEYNAAVDGTDICAINDVLAQMAETAAANSTITLTAKNPIEINEKCNVIWVPNKNINIVIDFAEGVYSKTEKIKKETPVLTLAYEDPDNAVTPISVEVISKLPDAEKVKKQFPFNLDAQLDKSAFGLVNQPAATSSGGVSPTGAPVLATWIDATAFVFGDSNLEIEDDAMINSYLNGDDMHLSDKVVSLTVDKNALIRYAKAPYGLVIPTANADAENDAFKKENAAIEAVTINGYFVGNVDAHAKAAKAVNLTVQGDDEKYALALGDFRVKGKADVLQRGLVLAIDRDGLAYEMETPDGASSKVIGGVLAAYEGVNVTGKSFVSGAIFTKNQNITINNQGLNLLELMYNATGAGKLSDLIYELLNKDRMAEFTALLAGLIDSEGDLGKIFKQGYGPLYAETGHVIVTSDNSNLVINDKVNTEVKEFLNPQAAKAVEYTVYANKNIDLFTVNGGTIQAAGNMWAEQDANLKGAVRVENTTEDLNAKIIAFRDLAMEGPSFAEEVTVGRNASVKVDPQDGKCEAIYTLEFYDNPNIDGGNTLFLTEGYIATVKNETEVALKHGTQPAFTAIGTVKNPDLLVAQKNPSIWNGLQIPANYAKYYVKDSERNIWTASQLAYQLEKITTVTPIIRSHIDLNDNPWPGIVDNASYNIQGTKIAAADDALAPQKKISGINLTGKGFIVGKLADGLTVKNLRFDGKSSIPAMAELQNVGLVASEVGGNNGRTAGGAALFENVTVVLTGMFGSDGVNNLQAEAIGGVLGLANGPVTFKGVRVNAKDATLAGYAGIGGLAGKTLNDVTISDATAIDEYGVKKGAVNGLNIKVTYKDVNQMKKYDTKQGMTGLYLGTVAFTRPAVDGENPVGNDIRINTTEDAINEPFGLEGADETLAVKYGNVEIEGVTYNGTFTFVRRDAEGKINPQTLVGQSGYAKVVQPKAVYINNRPYQVKEFLNETLFLSGILYGVLFEGTPE